MQENIETQRDEVAWLSSHWEWGSEMEFKPGLPYSTAVALDYFLCCLRGQNQRGQRDALIPSLHFTGLSDINTGPHLLPNPYGQITFTCDVRGGRGGMLAVKSLQSCPTLCDPMDCSQPGSSVHGIRQGRMLEWVAIPFSRGSSWSGIEPKSLVPLAFTGGYFTTRATWECMWV